MIKSLFQFPDDKNMSAVLNLSRRKIILFSLYKQVYFSQKEGTQC